MQAYGEAVKRNLEHLGTGIDEWTALPFKMSKDREGRITPEVDYSSTAGYETAPSLFPSTGTDASCELCGHPIKNVYAVKCDGRRWMMQVGSECITNFGEESGEAQKKAAMKVYKREALAYCCEVANAISAIWSYKNCASYEERARRLETWHIRWDKLRRKLPTKANRSGKYSTENLSDRSVAIWYGQSGERALEEADRGADYLGSEFTRGAGNE